MTKRWMHTMSTFTLIGLAASAAASTAAAAPGADVTARAEAERPGRQLRLQLDAGFGGPTGLYGGGLDVDLLPEWSIFGGVGASYHGDLQYALMSRVRIPAHRGLRLGLSLGMSGGEYRFTGSQHNPLSWIFYSPDDWHHSPFALWGNAEIFVEAQSRGPLSLGLYLGYAVMLNPDSYRCTSCIIESDEGSQNLFTGLRVGYDLTSLW